MQVYKTSLKTPANSHLKLFLRYYQEVVCALHIGRACKVMSHLQGIGKRSSMTVQNRYAYNRSPVHELDLFGWNKRGGGGMNITGKKRTVLRKPKHKKNKTKQNIFFFTWLCCDWFVCSALCRRKAEHVCKNTAAIGPCP